MQPGEAVGTGIGILAVCGLLFLVIRELVERRQKELAIRRRAGERAEIDYPEEVERARRERAGTGPVKRKSSAVRSVDDADLSLRRYAPEIKVCSRRDIFLASDLYRGRRGGELIFGSIEDIYELVRRGLRLDVDNRNCSAFEIEKSATSIRITSQVGGSTETVYMIKRDEAEYAYICSKTHPPS